MSQPVRALIIDDSASVRRTLSDILNADPDIRVIGAACDPYAAARKIAQEVPDVITLDVEMPRMDGITFLKKLMAQRPIPVVMCSSLTEENSATLMKALEAGAVDAIPKPRVDTTHFLLESSVRICDAVKAAARAKLGSVPAAVASEARARPQSGAGLSASPMRDAALRKADTVVCIGASTGGTESLRAVLEVLPEDSPGIVIVQHMPEKFTAAFAKRLDSLCAIEVKEAEDGDAVLRGRALIAPGNRHTSLQRRGSQYYVSVEDGPLVSRHRPSVNVLFRSAARQAGSNATGILMTGMGDDGADGLLDMRKAGAATVAQDEATSVVFGMPKEAIERGAACKIAPLNAIAHEIMQADRR
jgi:two-component system, chemotaxis family, protein-glutamate methylesterase/glutaminase